MYGDDKSCRTCLENDSFENESHLLKCSQLVSENDNLDVKYEDVFLSLEKQIKAVKVFEKINRKREIVLQITRKR